MSLQTRLTDVVTRIAQEFKSKEAKVFQVFKTSSLALTTSWTTITNWSTPTIEDSIYSFNTNALTVSEDGLYELNVWILGDCTGNNRVELGVRILLNDTPLPLAIDRQYAMRNNGQDEGSAQVNNYLQQISSGDTITVQAIRVGATTNLTNARITVKKIR